MFQKNFIGKNGFVWWIGVIENRVDPMGLGRCQVRIYGWHDDGSKDIKTKVETKDLPWAHAMFSLNTSKTWQAPNKGDWVLGFFFDGESGQSPCMLGVLQGFNAQNSGVGVETTIPTEVLT